MESKIKHIKKSAQKVRIAADIVRGMMVDDALASLEVMNKFAAKDVYKAVHSAKSNAVNNNGANASSLVIEEIMVDEGPSFKRYKEGSRGSYKKFIRRTCHITVRLTDLDTAMLNLSKKIKKEKVESKVEEVKPKKETTKKVTKTVKKETKVKEVVKKTTTKPKKVAKKTSTTKK